jgi:Ala-tRNA(Pro) deacylase
MPAAKLKQFLDQHGVKYVSIAHSPAFTAPEVAESAHIAGQDFAKTVIVKVDGEMTMVVLPANRKIDLADLREMLVSERVELATEDEFEKRFPDCERGAMPPFGNLYGLPVYIAMELAGEKEIAFNAGTHREIITMRFDDYARVARPIVMDFATT